MEELRQGWLSPTAEFVPMKNSESHWESAHAITKQIDGLSRNECFDAEETLLRRGWVKIGYNLHGDKKWYCYWIVPMSPEQRLVMRDCIENPFSKQVLDDESLDRWRKEYNGN